MPVATPQPATTLIMMPSTGSTRLKAASGSAPMRLMINVLARTPPAQAISLSINGPLLRSTCRASLVRIMPGRRRRRPGASAASSHIASTRRAQLVATAAAATP